MAITFEFTPELESRIQQSSSKIGLTIDGFIMESIQTYLDKFKEQDTKRAKRLPKKEANLMLKINQSLSQIEWAHYYTLIAKRQIESLTPTEQEELIHLSDEIEEKNAARIKYIAELAQLRDLTLPTMMKLLGIKPIAYV